VTCSGLFIDGLALCKDGLILAAVALLRGNEANTTMAVFVIVAIHKLLHPGRQTPGWDRPGSTCRYERAPRSRGYHYWYGDGYRRGQYPADRASPAAFRPSWDCRYRRAAPVADRRSPQPAQPGAPPQRRTRRIH